LQELFRSTRSGDRVSKTEYQLWLLQRKNSRKKEEMRHVVLEQPPFGEVFLEMQPLLTYIDITEDRSKSI